MEPAVRAAFASWASGLIIGLMPLAAHLALHTFATPVKEWDDNWSADVLFICITTSGLSVVSTFARMNEGSVRRATLSLLAGPLLAVTLGCFLFAGLLYGMTVSGRANDWTFTGAMFLLVASAVSSLYFDLSLAARTAVAGA
jgi:hypothetical protein